MELPFAFTLDASYVGQYSYDSQGAQGGQQVTNLNMIDLGTAYLPQNQDPTLSREHGPGPDRVHRRNLLRAYKGYGTINQFAAVFYRTSHGLQFSLQRRFSNGFSAGLNWNWTLTDVRQLLRGLLRDPAHRAPCRRLGRAARGSEGVRGAHEGPGHPHPHLQGQLRVGSPRPARRLRRGDDDRPEHRQRLAALRRLDRADGRGYSIGYSYQTRAPA